MLVVRGGVECKCRLEIEDSGGGYTSAATTTRRMRFQGAMLFFFFLRGGRGVGADGGSRMC